MNRAKSDGVLVALLSGAVFFSAHLRAFTSPYVINDDVRQQLYWMQQWLDPELFQGDLLTDYARHYVPWGVQGLYWLASWFVTPLVFSKVLPGLLFVLLGVCLYGLGDRLGNRGLGWTAVGVYWLLPFFLENLAGGLARAFAAPLLALFWLFWLDRRAWAMGAALFLQALFIPYLFPVAAAATLLAWGGARLGWGEPAPFPERPGHFGLLALAGGLVFLFQHRLTAAGFGPLVTAAAMANRPEFGAQGRYPLLPLPSLVWELIAPWETIAPFREWGVLGGGLVAALLLAVLLYGAWKLNWRELAPRLQPALCLALSSFLLYFLARLFLLKLFVPDRYLIYTLNLVYCLALALLLRAAAAAWPWPRPLAAPGRRALGLLILLVATLGGWRLQGAGLYDYSCYRPLYRALAQTPKDAVVAGHPNLMDGVPTFARRPALATYELAHPWSQGYWEKLKPRLDALFAAYYAADPEVVQDFCRQYQVAFLVVDDRHFTPAFLAGGTFLVPLEQRFTPGRPRGLAEQVEAPFFAPFAAAIRRQVKGRRQFALLAWSGPAVPVDEHIRLLDLRPCLSPTSPEPGKGCPP